MKTCCRASWSSCSGTPEHSFSVSLLFSEFCGSWCSLNPSVPRSCMMDSDDEVRDRATFYMNVLQQKQKALNAAYIFNGKKKHTHTRSVLFSPCECVHE